MLNISITQNEVKHFFNIDGLDHMNPNAPATDLKNQMVGLLQAVSYLKGTSETFANLVLFTNTIHLL